MNWGGQVLSDEATVADATELVSDALSVLVHDSLDSLSAEDLVDMLRDWESTRRRMAAFEHKMIREVENRGLPEKAGVKRTSKYLEQTLRIGHADASSWPTSPPPPPPTTCPRSVTGSSVTSIPMVVSPMTPTGSGVAASPSASRAWMGCPP